LIDMCITTMVGVSELYCAYMSMTYGSLKQFLM
jgi:hypothetical protein